ncbi:alpha/beta hydrolase [Ornithinimicrobium cavernae]|uniref:alpha/beta hydrolase n=1 Tax=Ornithinimicrobium cavernae TaxID=2666047 RepID=UPI001379525F|nr:alpha/beta hydrolase [Ornithinimicrobium cavernae]
MADAQPTLSLEATQLLAEAPPRAERPELSVEENRQALLRSSQAFGPGARLWSVRDAEVAGRAGPIPVRVYRPAPDPRGVLVFAHGGGWALGNLETHDVLCRDLADLVGCAVVAVDYRQPPERRFPAAVHDVVDVVRLVLDDEAELGLGGLPVAVAGDSAGGNLVAVAAQQLRGHPRLVHQLLLVPALDTRPAEWPSYADFSAGMPLTRRDMEWYWQQYLPPAVDNADPEVSPFRCADLTGLPPATIITAECDVLRDEGEAYAVRLREAGVPADVRRCEGMFHTFMLFGRRLSAAREAQAFAAERLQQAFAD